MKKAEEIRANEKVTIGQYLENGITGFVDLKASRKRATAFFVATWYGGWDHVSVSFRDRCPTWNEMCEVKDIFFKDDETCIEYHPAKSEYVNLHPYCLHIWRPQNGEIVTPKFCAEELDASLRSEDK